MTREGVIRTVGGWVGWRRDEGKGPFLTCHEQHQCRGHSGGYTVLNEGGILVEKCNNLIGQQESDGL